jgi:hypothetical protein
MEISGNSSPLCLRRLDRFLEQSLPLLLVCRPLDLLFVHVACVADEKSVQQDEWRQQRQEADRALLGGHHDESECSKAVSDAVWQHG